MNRFFTIHTDGSSKGNTLNSPAAIGYIIKNEEGDVVDRGSRVIPNTNAAEAEYMALKEGLHNAIHNFNATNVVVFSDNLNMVRHINNELDHYTHRSLTPTLVAHKKAIQEDIDKLDTFHLAHIFREFNTEADGLANAAYKVIKNKELYEDALV